MQKKVRNEVIASISLRLLTLFSFVTGAVSPEDLIQYAHRISQACSVVSPAGWQPSEKRGGVSGRYSI